MFLMETGPDTSIPGLVSSSGSSGTVQSPEFASDSGGNVGRTPSLIARSISAPRFSRMSSMAGLNLSYAATMNSRKSGVNSSSAPGTSACWTLDSADIVVTFRVGVFPKASLLSPSNGVNAIRVGKSVQPSMNTNVQPALPQGEGWSLPRTTIRG